MIIILELRTVNQAVYLDKVERIKGSSNLRWMGDKGQPANTFHCDQIFPTWL
jgi:hypothetical protein